MVHEIDELMVWLSIASGVEACTAVQILLLRYPDMEVGWTLASYER